MGKSSGGFPHPLRTTAALIKEGGAPTTNVYVAVVSAVPVLLSGLLPWIAQGLGWERTKERKDRTSPTVPVLASSPSCS